jgi:hypothetical protein
MGKPSPEYKMWLWGRCIQCLAPDHNVAHCRDLPHCLNYFGSGHFARRCRALPDLWRALFLSPSLPKPDICARLTFPPGSIHNRLTFLELSYATATASPPAEPMVPGDCFVAIPSPEVSVGPHRCCCRGGMSSKLWKLRRKVTVLTTLDSSSQENVATVAYELHRQLRLLHWNISVSPHKPKNVLIRIDYLG